MSKALTKAQADLDALKVELEAWIATQPAKRPRKPAAKRVPAPAPTVPADTPVEAPDTSWLDLLVPDPDPVPYVDATRYTHINLEPERVAYRPTAPQPVPVRRTLRQAFWDGYHGN